MGKNKKYITILILLILSQSGWSQVNRYMVFFTDKINSSYSVSSPSEYLSARAIERRERYGIPLTTRTFP
jgi:serine protease AprX